MRTALFLFALALTPLPAQKATPSRSEIAAMEQSFDNRLRKFSLDAPIELLGLTRGLYLNGYGAVFTTEVNLVQTPGISPFHPQISKEEAAHIRAAKQKRLPELRTQMREMLLASAQSLDRVPLEEQLVLGVFLFYNSWENSSGMPQLITMQAPRKSLLDVAMNRTPRTALDSVIQVREE
jgi:hypothetical protein